ncbi:MAG: TIR domain-containing protein [Aureispira sp.]
MTNERDWSKVVFLAHANEDKQAVKKLYRALKSAGLDPWMDEFDLAPGVRWDVEIQKAIRKCSFFLACLSAASINKTGYVQKELRFALDQFQHKPTNSIYFIPVLLEQMDLTDLYVDSIALNQYQASNAFERKGVQQLVSHLQQEAKIIKTINKTQQAKGTDLQTIRQYVAEGDLKLALDELEHLVNRSHPELKNNVILLKSRQHRLSQEHNLYLISSSDYQRESNRLVYAILETLDILEQKQ